MFVIGIISALLAGFALLMSIYSMTQLHKLGELNKTFFRTKGIKTISLYVFWILLLVGGILLSQENENGIPVFIAAIVVILIHLTVKMLISLLTYIQFSRIERNTKPEEIDLSIGLKKALKVNFIGWFLIGGIGILLINYLNNLSF